VWARWLAWDPVRMIDQERYRAALAGMRALYLDAGIGDEYNLQLGARQLMAKLAQAGIDCTHEEFDGGHFNPQHRYDRSLSTLTRVLQTS